MRCEIRQEILENDCATGVTGAIGWMWSTKRIEIEEWRMHVEEALRLA